MRHRRTDPICVRFAGTGRAWFVLGLRVPSLKRVRYDRGRGRSCEACHYDRLRRADERRTLERYFGGGVAHSIRLVGD